jgi:uncharacterized protein with HEPN domain
VPSRYDPAACLADILENVERIEGYLAGLDREAFRRDALPRDAVERCLERICEAAFRLGEKAAELPDRVRVLRDASARLKAKRHRFNRRHFWSWVRNPC